MLFNPIIYIKKLSSASKLIDFDTFYQVTEYRPIKAVFSAGWLFVSFFSIIFGLPLLCVDLSLASVCKEHFYTESLFYFIFVYGLGIFLLKKILSLKKYEIRYTGLPIPPDFIDNTTVTLIDTSTNKVVQRLDANSVESVNVGLFSYKVKFNDGKVYRFERYFTKTSGLVHFKKFL